MCRGIEMYANRSITGISLVIIIWNNTREHFFKRPPVFVFFFLAHSRFILGRSQSRNQGEGAKGQEVRVEDTRLEAKTKDTKKNPEAKAKVSLSEDKHSRGQGQECSRPRPRTKDTNASALQKKKKGLHKNFSGDLQKKKKGVPKKFSSDPPLKNVFQKSFQALRQNFNYSKNTAVLEPRTGQFSRTWGLEAKAKDLTFEAKAQGLQNVSSRTSSRPRTSSRTPPLLRGHQPHLAKSFRKYNR